jgi:hypothetical protein
MVGLTYHPARRIVILALFVWPLAIPAQVNDVNHLGELVGEYNYSITLDQPGVNTICQGKAKIFWINNNTIRSEFSNHQIDFVMEYDPYDKVYLLTYVLHPSEDICASSSGGPLLAIQEAELSYTEGVGYSYTEVDRDRDWTMDVRILVQEAQFFCRVNIQAGGDKCEHYLNFLRPDS